MSFPQAVPNWRGYLTIAGNVVVTIAMLMLPMTALPIHGAIQIWEDGDFGNGLAARPKEALVPFHPG